MSADEQLIRQESLASSKENVLSPVSSTNLSHRIVDQLIEAIKKDVFHPGQKLPSERELMQTFQVGRSSVREALHSLVALKLVEARAGKGYYVRKPGARLHGEDLIQFTLSEQNFLDIMEAREEIEPRIARIAAQRVLPEDLEAIEQTYAKIEEEIKQGTYHDYHRSGSIHLDIARASHNSVFLQIMETLIPFFPSQVRGRSIPVQEEMRMHRKLIDGLYAGDPDKMEKLMREHLALTRKFYLNALQKGGDKVRK